LASVKETLSRWFPCGKGFCQNQPIGGLVGQPDSAIATSAITLFIIPSQGCCNNALLCTTCYALRLPKSLFLVSLSIPIAQNCKCESTKYFDESQPGMWHRCFRFDSGQSYTAKLFFIQEFSKFILTQFSFVVNLTPLRLTSWTTSTVRVEKAHQMHESS